MEKLICSKCECENELSANKCAHCGHNLKKSRLWILLFLFLVLLIAYPFIADITIQAEIERDEYVLEPIETIRETNLRVPLEKEVCDNTTFRFSIQGGNVNSVGNNVEPNLRLINVEEKWGIYSVNFSFISEEKFPFDQYGGEKLLEKIDAGEIGHEDADFYSSTYSMYLGPGQSTTIDNPTLSPDPNKEYWAIADIREPTYLNCYDKIFYENKTENRSFVDYKEVKQKRKVREYKKLKEIIGVESFASWFVILFLLLLVIILLVKFWEAFVNK